jgi:DNA-directed RNA polymerase subunit RPC12/RpoP
MEQAKKDRRRFAMKAKYCYLCGKPLPKGRIKQCADCLSKAGERQLQREEERRKSKIKVCEYCGALFQTDKRTKKRQRFCGEECSRAWWTENSDKHKHYVFICKNCGKEFETVSINRNNACSRKCIVKLRTKKAQIEKKCLSCGKSFIALRSASDYCSKTCYLKSFERPCIICGKVFIPTRAGQTICSRNCTLKKGRDKFNTYKKSIGRNWDRVETLVCKYCGKTFQCSIFNQTPSYCSKKCARKAWADANPDKNRQMKARQRHMRRAMKYGNGSVEKINPIQIFKRDGWKCGICGKKVNPEFRFPHPLSPSLDHIIALASGGTHTWSNVQCSHFTCNCHKRDIGGGQLHLGLNSEVLNA